MSKNAAYAGWGVAGLLLVVLVSRCGGDAATSNTPSQGLLTTSAPAASTLYVQPTTANCRSGRSTNTSIVSKLNERQVVGVVREEGGWSLVDRSPACWVRSDLLDSSPPPFRPEPIRPAYASGNGSGGNSSRSRETRRNPDASSCPCRGNNVCIGPRGGRYCITSGGNKRYGV